MCSNYDKTPTTTITGYDDQVFAGYPAIIKEINKKITHCLLKKVIVTVECYPGVCKQEVLSAIKKGLQPDLVIDADECSYSGDKITAMIQRELTPDRVFGVMTCRSMDEFFDDTLIEQKRDAIAQIESGLVLVFGVGATLIHEGDILIYADMARWEIQQRYRRKELGNWKMHNYDEEQLRKYKRAFFIEWRIADRMKKRLYDKITYYLDTNQYNNPKMVSGEGFLHALRTIVHKPFRLVPYFDPGVWGGQWMKQVCDLNREQENFAWSFDGVPEENSLYFKFGDIVIESPAINAVFYQPIPLLGDKVHARFGAEFPIRFDFLDTIGGENLSLQVHPLTEYIQEKFGMHYTQDESYYILDTAKGASVYLGLKEGTDKEAMLRDLQDANNGGKPFDDTKYINKFEAKKHDHFLIPAGTIHCSSSNAMVLEISATPYIFTFKLWDWDRLGLDGQPRPVHLEHGKNVIMWDRTTKWVKENLINRIEQVSCGDGYTQERTGLHEREFIETRRFWFSKATLHDTDGIVNVLNLVEGREIVVKSPSNAFEPFHVHYAETFIIPAAVGAYTITPLGGSSDKKMAVIKAFVRV